MLAAAIDQDCPGQCRPRPCRMSLAGAASPAATVMDAAQVRGDYYDMSQHLRWTLEHLL